MCYSENISLCWAGNTDTKYYSIKQVTRIYVYCALGLVQSVVYTPGTWNVFSKDFFCPTDPSSKVKDRRTVQYKKGAPSDIF